MPNLRQPPPSDLSLPVQPAFSLVGEPLALARNGAAIISDSVSFIGYPIAFRGLGLPLDRGLGARETRLGVFRLSQGSAISHLGAEVDLIGPLFRGLPTGSGRFLALSYWVPRWSVAVL